MCYEIRRHFSLSHLGILPNAYAQRAHADGNLTQGCPNFFRLQDREVMSKSLFTAFLAAYAFWSGQCLHDCKLALVFSPFKVLFCCFGLLLLLRAMCLSTFCCSTWGLLEPLNSQWIKCRGECIMKDRWAKVPSANTEPESLPVNIFLQKFAYLASYIGSSGATCIYALKLLPNGVDVSASATAAPQRGMEKIQTDALLILGLSFSTAKVISEQLLETEWNLLFFPCVSWAPAIGINRSR